MRTSQVGLSLITRFEGLRLKRYTDGGGVSTIGYGHTGPDLPSEITHEQALEYLREDVLEAEEAVSELVKVGINQHQWDALVSFVFNLGEHAFAKSTLLRLLNRKEYTSAAEEFSKWDNDNGKRVSGLTRRRGAEQQLFLTPPPPSKITVVPEFVVFEPEESSIVEAR